MSYPSKIDLAIHTLHFLRGIEHGPVPSQPGVIFEPDLGRKLTTQEEELKKIAIEKVCEYLSQPGFGNPPPAPQPHPLAVMLAQAQGAEDENPGDADPPQPTAPAPEPGPKSPSDESKGPEKPPEPVKEPEKEREKITK